MILLLVPLAHFNFSISSSSFRESDHYVSNHDSHFFSRSTCNQSQRSKSVNCASRRLRRVPDDLLLDIQVLDASHNYIEILHNSSFVRYTFIKKLYLSFNGISVIQTGALSPLKLLQVLDLSHNKNLHLPSGMIFQRSVELSSVDLKWCDLSNFPSDTLAFLPSLRFLDLS